MYIYWLLSLYRIDSAIFVSLGSIFVVLIFVSAWLLLLAVVAVSWCEVYKHSYY